MGGRLAPPADELMNPSYATLPDKSDLWWRNIFENPTTVQFNHRVLAMTTYAATGAMYWLTRNPAMRSILPAATIRVATGAFAVANLQVLLGISTLLYLVQSHSLLLTKLVVLHYYQWPLLSLSPFADPVLLLNSIDVEL